MHHHCYGVHSENDLFIFVSAVCAMETFKLATRYLNTFMDWQYHSMHDINFSNRPAAKFDYTLAIISMIVFNTSCSKPLQNYMVFNDTDGVYTFAFEAEKNVRI